jgi:hypothetical protein
MTGRWLQMQVQHAKQQVDDDVGAALHEAHAGGRVALGGNPLG